MTLLLLLASLTAHADWQANSTTRILDKDKEPLEIQAKLYFKKNKIRLDAKTPTDTSVIVDITNKSAVTLVHPAKIQFTNRFKDVQNQLPLCSDVSTDKKIEQCLKIHRFKIVRSEKIQGFDCHVYEGKVKNGVMKIWKPTALKEIPMVQSSYQSKDGKTVETSFHQIQETPIEDGFFTIPSNYKKAQGVESLLKSFQK